MIKAKAMPITNHGVPLGCGMSMFPHFLDNRLPDGAGRVTVTFLRSHVTGSNDAILSEVGRTMAVSLVGTHHGPGMRWDTSSWFRWATRVLESGFV
jgi:hypothetical protein